MSHDNSPGSLRGSHRALSKSYIAVAVLVAGCTSFDPDLLKRPGEDLDAPAEGDSGVGAGAVDARDAGSGGGGGGGVLNSATQAGSGGTSAGMDGDTRCMENPESEEDGCPLICPESCNDQDDDCDGAIDEGDIEQACDLDHAVAACIAGECRIIECSDGHRDCDGDADTGCETTSDDVMNCGQCGRSCRLPNAIEACIDGACVAIGCDRPFADCDDESDDCETAINTLDNCGVCGVTCSDVPNATPSCEKGYCGPGTCATDYGDCNVTPGDGCEQMLNTNQHCGACNTLCALPGASADCSTGVCLETGCDEDHADCDGDPIDGCDSLDSSAHCGACNAKCDTSLDRVSSAMCVAKQCMIECASGYGDCDLDPATGCETEVRSLQRCGDCDTPCGLPNAEVSCDAGSCEFVRCKPGWGDCNGDVEFDGCETSLNVDTTCGDCDADCTVTTDPVCSGGSCGDLVCPDPDTADCAQDGLPCEVDLTTNVDHCGACDSPCAFTTATPHATLTCTNGACRPLCAQGYGNCNGDYRDGCEMPLNTLAHCGSCNMACSIANASETCASGSCEVDACAADWADCNMDDVTCETQLGTTSNCTGCGAACSLQNAVPTCSGMAGNHSCQISACTQAYYENCDGMHGNGCEVDKRNSVAHCGVCNNDCRTHANVQSATCSSSACNYTCQSSYGNCTTAVGCETQLNSLTHCGGCNVACSRTNGTASCSSGTCQLTGCNSGYGNCDGSASNGCEPLNTVQNCGSCGTPCLITNGTGTCATQSCAVASCNSGWDNCDGSASNGCERNVNAPASGGQGPCLPDTNCTQFTYNSRAYYFCTGNRTWSDARSRCQLQLLGDLVHINDSAEDAFVRSHLVANAWLGAQDTTEGVWRWANDGVQFWSGAASGTALAYENWNSGEPNDSNGNEDCVEMRQSDGLWNDQNCTTTLDFVCEVQADLCPGDPDKTNPGQCGCGVTDTDSDGDGTANCNDACPSDSAKTSAGQCGCGVADTDSDGDGTANCNDACPSDPAKTNPGQCGCGVADTDSDGDGTANCNDACPNDSTRTTPPCGYDYSYTPSNFDPATIDFASAPNSTLDCGTTTVDSSGTDAPTITNWCGAAPTAVVRAQTGGPDVVILPLQALTVSSGSTLRLIGTRPVILAVAGDATIGGTINARGVGATPGAGGNVSCTIGTGAAGVSDSGSNSGGGGGGGGAFGVNGANGGSGHSGGNGGAAGTAEGNANLSPLRGGCSGGAGGNGDGTGGVGGGGGGAVQISAMGTISIPSGGIVSASGGGGLRGSSDEDGGGGGGSGGAVLLEAATVTGSSGAWVTANGGGGGSGNATGSANGSPGTDGYQNQTARAPGGNGSDGGGDGGDGGAQAGAPTFGSGGGSGSCLLILCTSGGGGGGGGGGVGRVRVRGISSCTLSGSTSPAATCQ